MTDLKAKYADKLEWLEMGIPYTESPDENPNAHCFSLGILWSDLEPLLQENERLTTEVTELKDALGDFDDLHFCDCCEGLFQTINTGDHNQCDTCTELANVSAEVKSAFHAGFVYAAADVKRGHRTWNDVDKKFHEWKASDLGVTPSGRECPECGIESSGLSLHDPECSKIWPEPLHDINLKLESSWPEDHPYGEEPERTMAEAERDTVESSPDTTENEQ